MVACLTLILGRYYARLLHVFHLAKNLSKAMDRAWHDKSAAYPNGITMGKSESGFDERSGRCAKSVSEMEDQPVTPAAEKSPTSSYCSRSMCAGAQHGRHTHYYPNQSALFRDTHAKRPRRCIYCHQRATAHHRACKMRSASSSDILYWTFSKYQESWQHICRT